MLEQLTDGQRMELALAICPELGEIKQFAQRAEQKGFQRGYGHGVSDVGTPEQAEATAEWRADISHGEGPERFDVATKPPFSKGSGWVKPASGFSQTLSGLASPFLGKLVKKRIYESAFIRERLVQDAIKQLQPDYFDLSKEEDRDRLEAQVLAQIEREEFEKDVRWKVKEEARGPGFLP